MGGTPEPRGTTSRTAVPRSTKRCSRTCRGTPLARAHLRHSSGTITRSVVARCDTLPPDATRWPGLMRHFTPHFDRLETKRNRGTELQYSRRRRSRTSQTALAGPQLSCDSLLGAHATVCYPCDSCTRVHATLYPLVDGRGAKTCDSLPGTDLSHATVCYPCDSLLGAHATVCYPCDSLLGVPFDHATLSPGVMRQFAIHATVYSALMRQFAIHATL